MSNENENEMNQKKNDEQKQTEVVFMRESISKGLSEDGMVRKLGEHIDFLIMDIVSEKLRYEKTHELLKTLKDAAVTVVDSESAMIKLAVDGYFSRMEIEKSHFDDIISELMKLKESVDGTITYMQENHKRQTDGEIKDLMEKVYQLTNRIEQLETVPVTVEPKVKTSYRDERPSVVPAVRRDPGETEKLVGKIAIRKNYRKALQTEGAGKENFELIRITRDFFPEILNVTVGQYLRTHMKYIGKQIKLKKKDFLKAYDQTEVLETKKKYPSKIKGTKLKGRIAKKAGKTYSTTLTEERYIIILQTVRDNPGIIDDSIGKTTGMSQNAGYAHLMYGAHEKVGDIVMKSKQYTITEQGMKTLRHLQKSHKRKGKEIEKEQKAKITEQLKETLVAPLEDDKKVVQTPRKKTAEDEALDKKYEVIAKKIAEKSEATGKQYLMDRDALHIYKTYGVTIEKEILDELEKRIKEAFNYRITFIQLAELTKNSKAIVDAHVRYGIRKKMFAPCGLNEKRKPEVCEYERQNEVMEQKNKAEKVIKIQSKSILDGEKKDERKDDEGKSLWKKIRGEKKQ